MPQTNAGYNITPNRTYNWQEQPYVSWKGESSNSAVPTWSRPLPIYDEKDNGPSFKARPIKHWRRQLFPRQYIDDNTKQPLPDLPNDTTDVHASKLTRGRHYSGLN